MHAMKQTKSINTILSVLIDKLTIHIRRDTCNEWYFDGTGQFLNDSELIAEMMWSLNNEKKDNWFIHRRQSSCQLKVNAKLLR